MGTATRHARATLAIAILGGTALLGAPVTAGVLHAAAAQPSGVDTGQVVRVSAITAHKHDHDADAANRRDGQRQDGGGNANSTDNASTAHPGTHRGDPDSSHASASNSNSSDARNSSSSNNTNNSQSGSNGSSLIELNNVLENSLNGLSIHVLGN